MVTASLQHRRDSHMSERKKTIFYGYMTSSSICDVTSDDCHVNLERLRCK